MPRLATLDIELSLLGADQERLPFEVAEHQRLGGGAFRIPHRHNTVPAGNFHTDGAEHCALAALLEIAVSELDCGHFPDGHFMRPKH